MANHNSENCRHKTHKFYNEVLRTPWIQTKMAKSAADSVRQLTSSDKEPQNLHHYDRLVKSFNEDSKYGAKKDHKGNHKGDAPFALPELSILTHLSANSHSDLTPLLLTLPKMGNAGGMNANGGHLVQVLLDTGSLGLNGN